MAVQTHLAAIRKSRNFGAAELARRAGISRQTLYAIEAGAYVPNTSVALQLARILNVPVEKLFSLNEESDSFSQAELIAPMPAWSGRLVQICKVGDRTIAVPSEPSEVFIGPADAMLSNVSSDQHTITLNVLEKEALDHNLLVAGCDPALPILARHAAQDGLNVVPWYCNSSQALELLMQRRVHIAGYHLHNETTELPSLLPTLSIVTLAYWQEGLIVAPGNPKNISRVEDLARPDITIINRETGAGSRNILDTALTNLGLPSNRIQGYEQIAKAHLAAARSVFEGHVDCCIAPLAVARALGLGFIPLLTERYDFITCREFLVLPTIQTFFNVLNKHSLRSSLSALGGYDTSVTGQTIA